MEPLPSPSISSYELSSSPNGQLVSFQPDDALAKLLAALAGEPATCDVVGGALIATLGPLSIEFAGAAEFALAWSAQPAPTYLCAFHPRFLDGALALALRWASGVHAK